jgi:predicted glycosyltransferase
VAQRRRTKSDVLFETFVNRVCAAEDKVKAVVLPRNKRQEAQIRRDYPNWFRNSKVVIPATVVDGLNLLWHSDLAVSGGGTMNREAAALGVPVYSIFRGAAASVDVRLQADGRLIMIGNTDEVHQKIPLKKRPRNSAADRTSREALPQILGYIDEILAWQDSVRR